MTKPTTPGIAELLDEMERSDLFVAHRWAAQLRVQFAELETQHGRALEGAELYRAMMDACEKLPEWWNITFEVEHHGGWVSLTDPEANAIGVDTFGSCDSTLAEQVGEALAFALEHDTSDAAIAQRGGKGE